MCEQSSSIEVAEHVQVDLAADLARRIRRRRVDGHLLDGRIAGRDAVDRSARGGVHHLADAGLTGGLCQTHRADDVDAGVELRIVHRQLHRDLRGEVEDHLGLDVGEQTCQVGLDDVGLDELEVVVALGRCEVLAAPRAEVVDPDDRVTVRQQAIYQRRSDETGRPRDQCAHRLTIPVGAAGRQSVQSSRNEGRRAHSGSPAPPRR